MPASSAPASPGLPTVKEAVDAFFDEFDFAEGSPRTKLSYRSGARAFLRFIADHPDLSPETSIDLLSSSISADFNAWMQTATHNGPGLVPSSGPSQAHEGYSISSRRVYNQALSRLLRFWWYRSWLTFSPEEEDRARKALQLLISHRKHTRVQTRSESVPTDFGDRMLHAANALPLPTPEDIPNPKDRRKARLETLRARALVAMLRATALRVGDLCSIERKSIELARETGGYMRIEMAKTKLSAHIVLGEGALAAVDAYLDEREDSSPWVFIQHGSTCGPPRGRDLSPSSYRRRKRGYGARISPGLVRSVVVDLAKKAGYNPEENQFVSTHAFRHWHAQRMVDLDASIDEVQSVLGHARSETTRGLCA